MVLSLTILGRLHYITLHYITLRYVTLHAITPCSSNMQNYSLNCVILFYGTGCYIIYINMMKLIAMAFSFSFGILFFLVGFQYGDILMAMVGILCLYCGILFQNYMNRPRIVIQH